MSVNNIDKLLQYIIPVSINPIEICKIEDSFMNSPDPDPDAISIFDKPKSKIVLGGSFFMKDTCNMCGHCCPPETNLYTEFEYKWMKDCPENEFTRWGLDPKDRDVVIDGLIPEYYYINGEHVKLYRFPGSQQQMLLPRKGKEVPRCHWLIKNKDDNYVCRIHPIVSITCEMPHLRILHIHETVSIGITQFGRNWALGCPVEFSEPQDEKEFEEVKTSRIAKLSHLAIVADDMNIKTYLPDIIGYVKNIPYDDYKSYLHRPIVQISNTRKLFDINV